MHHEQVPGEYVHWRARSRSDGVHPLLLQPSAGGDIMIHDSDLLKPSLSPGRDAPAAIYSVRAIFITSFFGGPVASALITLVNAHRLRRLARDWPIGLLALAVVVTLRWSMSRHILGSIEEMLGGGTATYLREFAGLAFFGLGYALHAPYYRSLSYLDLPTPNGLGVGISCIVVAIGVEFGLVLLFPS